MDKDSGNRKTDVENDLVNRKFIFIHTSEMSAY